MLREFHFCAAVTSRGLTPGCLWYSGFFFSARAELDATSFVR